MEKKLIHKGKWANADVFLCTDNGHWRVEKNFNHKHPLVRWTIGILLTWRENLAFKRLAGLPGIPSGYARESLFSLSYNYLTGVALGAKGLDHALPADYFFACEKLLNAIHDRKIVHLDLRRAGNWIVRTDGSPGIIDFQSAFSVALLPARLKNFLFLIDYSGLYKIWERKCRGGLDRNRKAILSRINRTRRLWIFSFLFPAQ